MSNSDNLLQPLARVTKIFHLLLSANSWPGMEHTSVCSVFSALPVANSGMGSRLTELAVSLPMSVSQCGFDGSIFALLKAAQSVRHMYLSGIKNMPTDLFYGAHFDNTGVLECSFGSFPDLQTSITLVRERKFTLSMLSTKTNSQDTCLTTTTATPLFIKRLYWNNYGLLSPSDEAAIFGVEVARTQEHQEPGPGFKIGE